MKSDQGYSCFVNVGDEAAAEYKFVKKDGNRYECFIASVPDAAFTISVVRLNGSTSHTSRNYLDGLKVAQQSSGGRSTQDIKYSLDGLGDMRPFKWSAINLTDDADLCVQKESIIKALGTIEVSVRRTKSVRSVQRRRDHGKPQALAADMVFDEKSKKAQLSSVTGLGEPTRGEPMRGLRSDYIDKQPYVVFVFSYRSQDMLEVQGIKPVSLKKAIIEPDPPSKTAADVNEELRRVKEENKELREAIELKRAHVGDERYKRKKFKTDKNGVIDLTDD